MMVKEWVCDALTASSGLAALVGDRIYYAFPPQAADYPLVTYRQVGGSADWLDGRNYLARARVEVKVWGEASDVEEAAEEVRRAMDGCRGSPVLVSEVDLGLDASLVHVKALDFNLILKL